VLAPVHVSSCCKLPSGFPTFSSNFLLKQFPVGDVSIRYLSYMLLVHLKKKAASGGSDNPAPMLK
jgi:hypothetical protein